MSPSRLIHKPWSVVTRFILVRTLFSHLINASSHLRDLSYPMDYHRKFPKGKWVLAPNSENFLLWIWFSKFMSHFIEEDSKINQLFLFYSKYNFCSPPRNELSSMILNLSPNSPKSSTDIMYQLTKPLSTSTKRICLC